jgi:hypothetical protein
MNIQNEDVENNGIDFCKQAIEENNFKLDLITFMFLFFLFFILIELTTKLKQKFNNEQGFSDRNLNRKITFIDFNKRK